MLYMLQSFAVYYSRVTFLQMLSLSSLNGNAAAWELYTKI